MIDNLLINSLLGRVLWLFHLGKKGIVLLISFLYPIGNWLKEITCNKNDDDDDDDDDNDDDNKTFWIVYTEYYYENQVN
jgi:hypothetical protein